MGTGLIGIKCAWCHRTKQGERWVEDPEARDSDSSHGICSECAALLRTEAEQVLKAHHAQV